MPKSHIRQDSQNDEFRSGLIEKSQGARNEVCANMSRRPYAFHYIYTHVRDLLNHQMSDISSCQRE